MTIERQTANSVKTTKPRRWFRFRLRTLLVMVTLLSVSLGWVGWELDQRRREKEVVEWVEKMGGAVYFPSYFSNDERSRWEKTTDKWFGERVQGVLSENTQVSDLTPLAGMKRLVSLSLVGTQVSDPSPLSELKNLRVLLLNGTQVSDLSPLAELKNLQCLYLDDTQVSDLSPLAKLKNLEQLYLRSTPVTKDQVQELRLALPNSKIEF